MKLIIENVRCFHAKQEIPIRPVTLLVGENSTGKTTFLAAYRIAWDIAWGTKPIDFNEPPFELGTYDQLANFRGGRGGRAKSFTIGFVLEPDSNNIRAGAVVKDTNRIYAHFAKGEAQPELTACVIETRNMKVIISRDAKNLARLRIETKTKTLESDRIPLSSGFSFINLGRFPIDFLFRDSLEKEKMSNEELNQLRRILRFFRRERVATPKALAPIRSKPERVYSKMKDIPVPSGEHTPMLISRNLGGNDSSELNKELKRYGSVSGMFQELKVKPFGNKEGDPFQILVSSQGPPFNLVDVGYGVSQVLPILVDSILSPSDTVFLMQQPEVHLHPRAQAELGSLFGHLAKSQGKTFIVETHSDYILDRIRLDVRDKKYGLKPEDVVILYFEKNGAEATIHPITIDKSGNIQDAPPGYRRFFMEEEKRYFGV